MKSKRLWLIISGIIIVAFIIVVAVVKDQPAGDKSGGTMVDPQEAVMPPVGAIGMSLTVIDPIGEAEFGGNQFKVKSFDGSAIDERMPVQIESITKNDEILVSKLAL